MTLEKAYERFGGRYTVVHQRLKKDERIMEYLGDFLEDEEFDKLKKALENGDDRTAFRAIHTLKGISMNLGLVNLEKICISLTENLRDSSINAQTPTLFEQLEKEYTEVCTVIRQLLNNVVQG
ncbi:MAG: Hpt domain-containing protein [Eubacteriales bacterium]|nr:Hpt domain-containing protein [Eubacteriales bacterium]